MNKFSNNIIAEGLVKKIDSISGKTGSLDSGLKGLASYLKPKGFNAKNLKLLTPSGLNPENKASAKAFTNYLKEKILEDINSSTLISGFPIAGVDGTLSRIKKYNFTGKTGTLNNITTLTGIYKGKKTLIATLMVKTKNKNFSKLHKIRESFISKLGSL